MKQDNSRSIHSENQDDNRRKQKKSVIVTPSIICSDMSNLEKQAREFIELGIEFVHADIIDGKFSPSSPLSFDMLKEIYRIWHFPLDFHIMALDNEAYIERALEFNARQICFHCETTLHIDRLLNLIKKSNVLCGIALTPTTPISVLEYAIELCDFILLMLINPGYASDSDESQVIYAERKVSDCRIFLESHHRSIPIEIDGRISFHNISDLVTAGADIIVAGSSSMFHKGKTIQENYRLIEHAINVGLCNRLS